MSKPVNVSLEFTPNPNTLKYVVDQTLIERGAANFPNKETATKSPLAQKLFQITGVAAIMIGKNFVTVTKGDAGDWESLNRGVTDTLYEHLGSGLSVLDADFAENSSSSNQTLSAIEEKIKQILDAEVRPAVAMDGGDITFDKFEDGIVYLYLQGSCSGCPSSTATLKMGIETRLKDAIPEVKEVVSI